MFKKLFTIFLVLFAVNAYGNELQESIDTAAEIIEDFKNLPEKGIPESILRKAHGLAILNIIKAGFLVSGRGGVGIVVARTSDGWSAPSAIGVGGAGIGLQVGAEVTECVIVLNTKAAVDAFKKKGNFILGAELSAVAGPIGRSAEAGVTATAATYSYSISQGLFAGISLEGLVIGERKETNEQFYGKHVTAAELLSGKVAPPKSAANLYKALKTYK